MKICFSHISALEAYRASGLSLPELLTGPRTSRLDECGITPRIVLEEEADRLGIRSKPYHLLLPKPSRSGAREDVQRHVCARPLPKNALIKARKDVLLAGPELLFCELAALDAFDEVELALVGYELCGTYLLDSDESSWSGMLNTSEAATSTDKIKRALSRLDGRDGAKKARCAIEMVVDGSHSPMETILAALIAFPRKFGGLGLGPLAMNRKIQTPAGHRWVDIMFPERGVGLEYKGREFHSPDKVGRDDRRQNKLVSSGVVVLNVWYEDLADAALFDQLVRDLVRTLGVRLRIRDKDFARKQNTLRMRLMPSIKRFGSAIR